jgi:trimeric autotransporter adhesin
VSGYGGDGGPATAAKLSSPNDVACDRQGKLFIADTGNHRIRRVDAVTGIITTVAGSGVEGFRGDGRSALRAHLNSPLGVAVDATGTIYISDTGNDRIRRVRRGIIKTLAGRSAGFGGDGGPAKRALLDTPFGIALDPAGNLYVADAGNHRIRRILSSTRKIDTVAGGGATAYPSDGVPATAVSLYNPYSIAIDDEGNLLIADTAHLAIRCVKGVAARP